MSIQNLAIVFGPTLFSQVAPSTSANGQMNGGMADAGHQNKVRFGEYSNIYHLSFPNQAIQTILEHYKDIFVDEPEG